MTAETTTSFDGWFHDVYVGNGKDLVPEWAILGEMVEFDQANKIGGNYVKGVVVRIPHGVTYGTRGTAYTLNASIPLQTQDATLSGASFHLKEDIATDLFDMSSSTKQAFRGVMDSVVMGMTKSSYLYREIPLLYGGRNMGQLASSTDPGAGTTATWTFSDATWAPGLWAQLEGASVDAYDDPADGGTKHNSGGAITVGAIDVEARTVAVTGDNTSLAAIYAAATDVYVKPVGADGKWFNGLAKIVPHTSGSLMGINATTYSIWRGATTSASSAKLTFSTINKAANLTLGRGGYGKRTLLVSNATWADLNNDSAEFRSQVNKKGGDFSLGAEQISFYASSGHITVVMHPMLMRGYAYLINPDVFTRIGSTDHTWGIDGKEGKYLQMNESSASYQIRCRWEQALFCDDLSQNCEITSIVPNAAG